MSYWGLKKKVDTYFSSFLIEILMTLIHIIVFNHYLMINQITHSSQIFLNLQFWIQLGILLFRFYRHLNSDSLPVLLLPWLTLSNWQAPSPTQLAKPGFCKLSLTPEFSLPAFSNHLLISFWKRLLILAILSFIIATDHLCLNSMITSSENFSPCLPV